MVICIGETVIDYIDDKPYIGGSVLNTAKAASRMGASVSYLSEISSDEFGLMTLQDIIDNCIMFEPQMCNSPFKTMTSKAVEKDGKVSYEFEKEGTTAINISSQKMIDYISTNSTVECIFTGSVTFSDKKAREEIIKTIDSLKKPFIYFDPNVRPSLIDDMEEYCQSVKNFASRCDIFKCSNEDLAYLGWTEKEALSYVKSDLIVTYGDKGSSWFKKDGQVFYCSSFSVQGFVDTIGCGDTFNGAVLSYLDKNKKYWSFDDSDRQNILEFASKASAVNCQRKGCNPPYMSEL